MTPEQKDLVIKAAQMGVAMGLFHPVEWYVNYDRSLQHWLPYEKIPEESEKVFQSFAAFFRGCYGSPEEAKYWDAKTDEQMLAELIDQHYSGKGVH